MRTPTLSYVTVQSNCKMVRVASQVFPRALNFACLAILFFAVTNLSLSKGGAIPKPKPSNEPHKPVDVKLSDEVHFDKNQEHNDGQW